MKGNIAAVCVGIMALGMFAAPLSSQTTVQGRVVVHSGPVTGHVELRRRTRVIVPERHVIVVQRVHVPRGWWKKHSYRAVTVYYDGHRYYLRRYARPNLRAVIVYERGGRYFIGEDHWKRKHRKHDRHDDRYRDYD
jgi:hypothetical protein